MATETLPVRGKKTAPPRADNPVMTARIPTPRGVRDAPLAEVLSLLSAEGLLVCAGCRAWYDACSCPGFSPAGLVPVTDVLPHKNGPRLRSAADGYRNGAPMPPLQVEDGVLLDGHHRVRAAVIMALPSLPLRPVRGVLAEQIAWHRHLAVARDAEREGLACPVVPAQRGPAQLSALRWRQAQHA